MVAAFLVLGYRPPRELLAVPSRERARRVTAVVLLLVTIVVGTGVATVGQVSFERDANAVVDGVASEPEYEGLTVVTVRSEYADYSPFTGPETVIVEVSRTDGETYPGLADRISEGIREETDRTVDVRVEFVDRQESS